MCFLIPLIHSHPSSPQQHLWALVPTENWSYACLSWACEPCQILIECFKPGGEVYLAINRRNSDHTSTLSNVENVLEWTGKQTYMLHPLHSHTPLAVWNTLLFQEPLNSWSNVLMLHFKYCSILQCVECSSHNSFVNTVFLTTEYQLYLP